MSPDPVSLKATLNIIDHVNNSKFGIFNKGKGTGFFTKINFHSKLLPVLITNNYVIHKNDLKNNIKIIIYLNNDK